ncbi:hypothetical protein V8C86DRAFT_2820351 [Haematococcus lacustris]
MMVMGNVVVPVAAVLAFRAKEGQPGIAHNQLKAPLPGREAHDSKLMQGAASKLWLFVACTVIFTAWLATIHQAMHPHMPCDDGGYDEG